jgi:F-type H+-transporting ATPase subunit gamma
MANLKELRRRITSVGSTMKITSAMKMVSASKLKKAQDAIQSMRPFSQKLTEILQKLSANLNTEENPYAQQREVNKVLLVVLTSNRGLCGGFNSSVIKAAYSRMNQLKGAEVEVFAVGKKAVDSFKRTKNVVQNETDVWNDLSFEKTNVFAEEIMQGFIDGKWDRVELVYNQFRNAAVQIVQTEQFLPIVIPQSENSDNTDYIFEPSKERIIEMVIPVSLRTQFYKAFTDSQASEHGARMTAMHKATDNAKDLQSRLKLEYNKARQAAITNEILEIVSGANALEG